MAGATAEHHGVNLRYPRRPSARRFVSIAVVACAIALSPAAALAQVEELAGNDTIIELTEEPQNTTEDVVEQVEDAADLEESDPLPTGDVDPTKTLNDVVDDLTDEGTRDGEGGSGGGAGKGKKSGERAGSGGETGSISTGAGSGGGGTVRTTLTGDDGSTVDLSLAPAKSYTSVIGDGAMATAERALRLARPLAPPLLLAGFALAILIAVARGNDKLVRVEPVAQKRIYRL